MKGTGSGWRQKLLAAVAFAGLLCSCDPGVTVHLVRSDSLPMSCTGHSEMTYRVHIQYRDGERYTERFTVDEGIDHPTIGMLPGGIEREVAWIRFEVFCGSSETPILVTPRIMLPDELVRRDEWNYHYAVDWKSATHSHK